jgi:GntR family transcriptional regulator
MPNSSRTFDVRSGFFNPFPRYLQIRNILVRRINDGFAPGDRFPTEHEICEEFGVSRETVREALRGMESDGLIARHRGKGTFVARLPERADDERLTGLVEDFTELKLNTQASVMRAGPEKPPPRIARALQLGNGEQVFRISRLRRVEGATFACHDAFLPLDVGAKVARLDLTHTTLFHELRQTLGIKLAELYLELDAMSADLKLARMLEIDIGAPILVTRRAIGEPRHAAPTMFFEAYFRADRYFYTVRVEPGARKSLRTAAQRNRA